MRQNVKQQCFRRSHLECVLLQSIDTYCGAYISIGHACHGLIPDGSQTPLDQCQFEQWKSIRQYGMDANQSLPCCLLSIKHSQNRWCLQRQIVSIGWAVPGCQAREWSRKSTLTVGREGGVMDEDDNRWMGPQIHQSSDSSMTAHNGAAASLELTPPPPSLRA